MARLEQYDDALLEMVDERCINMGEPILSVLVRRDDGTVADAFWVSVLKYNLRQPGETDAAILSRLSEEAFGFHSPRH